GLDPCGPEDGTDAGRDRATDESGLIEREIDVDRDRSRSGQHDVVGEAARVQQRADRLALTEGARLCEADDVFAELLLESGAAAPAAARHLPTDEHEVAGGQTLYICPDALDHARALVAEQDRREAGIAHLRDVRVAETGGAHADAHLARPGRVDGQLVQTRPLAERVEDEPARFEDVA